MCENSDVMCIACSEYKVMSPDTDLTCIMQFLFFYRSLWTETQFLTKNVKRGMNEDGFENVKIIVMCKQFLEAQR